MKKVAKKWLIAMFSIGAIQLGIFIWFVQQAEQRFNTFIIALLVAVVGCIYCGYRANRQYNTVD